MQADPADQLRLLDLQQLDSSLVRLAQRRRTLAEIAERTALAVRRRELTDAGVLARTELADLHHRSTRLEGDIDQVRSRADRDRQRLASGAVSAPRELTELQSEIESLGRRQTALEDDELELMELMEGVDARVSAAAGDLAAVEAQEAEAERRQGEAEAAIDADAAFARAGREQLAPQLPEALVALYEQVRKASDGVGAAPLHARRCQGCHLELAGSELAAAHGAAPTEVLRCENCRRILIRTPESGL